VGVEEGGMGVLRREVWGVEEGGMGVWRRKVWGE
jgi:hypothetical protein